ncbi:GNAT family N-acetyltransferase [Plastoroseomonas hellenica]|uniref:GNAT family N-acetyltransferase n=1 Tax=Plastoroseomonas hellenica TaxID=2687306 RepID=UPI001BAD43C2|nr:GNAT family N-acetyltransferase [Plastoroseomonas hellenica]MBR0644916.1 N-acetyltransferase [Plastoroseomonas hellenica]
MIRAAADTDVPGILDIYNDVIVTSTAVYSDDPVTLDNRRAWLRGRQQQGYPVLVAAEGDAVVGFASFGDFRSSPGYRYTVEHTVHVHPERRGTGIGRQLIESLIPLAVAQGKHVMIAGVDAANSGSIRFHERLGFIQVARFEEVGFKFGRWLDLVFLQRKLGG